MIRVGASGFSYKDWVGPYYPPDLNEQDWLAYYAREFSTCELNFTYYRLPNAKTLARMADKTPPGFMFAVKAFQGLTHERDVSPDAQAFHGFTASLQPLLDADKFGCVLAQFPFSFHATKENRDYVRRLRDGLRDLATVVEFRNDGWLTDTTFVLLSELQLGFCCVDEPRLKGLIPPIAKATGPVAYVRFHGRNEKKWWRHEPAWERYDYAYTSMLTHLCLHIRGAGRVAAQDQGAGCRGPADAGLYEQSLEGAGGGHSPAAQAPAQSLADFCGRWYNRTNPIGQMPHNASVRRYSTPEQKGVP